MRVLWFSPINLGSQSIQSHNGGGWILSLKELLMQDDSLEIGIAFEGQGKWGACKKKVHVFPIQAGGRLKNRLRKKLDPGCDSLFLLPEMKRAIDDFKPDLIHVWGSESALFSICRHTSIPCVTHLQGFLPAYLNAKYPPGIAECDVLHHIGFHPLRQWMHRYFTKVFVNRASQEAENMRFCSFFMGRTDWDRAIVSVYNPNARYFHCDELLRNEFYSGVWQLQRRKSFVITSVISSPLYKGHDVILKTAKMLKTYTDISFVWKIYGIDDLTFWEKKLKINAAQNGVMCCGSVSAVELKKALLGADVYIHPSYIDNSPNSLCEAQMLGLPVIAANVGGVSSLICHGENGLLFPANDPVMLVSLIQQLYKNDECRISLGGQAKKTAEKRHDPETIKRSLLEIYYKILQDKH